MIWLLRNPLQAILGGLSLTLFVAAGVQTVRLGAMERAHADVVAQHVSERAHAAEAARQASEAYRRQEQQWAAQRVEQEARHANEKRAIHAQVAALRAANDGLRNDLSRAAAECGQAADDPVAACREYAARVGHLLAEYRDAGLQAAQAAETHASDVRRLLGEWPR